MKTINDVIDTVIKDFMLMSNEDERKPFIRAWLEQGSMFIGSGCDKVSEKHIAKNLTSNLDATMMNTAKVRNYGNPDMPRLDDVYKALSIHYFLSLSDEDKKKMLDNPVYIDTFSNIDRYYLRYIPIEYRKLICSYNGDKEKGIWDKLLCIEDFDNVTDDQILNIMNTRLDGFSHAYEIARYLFGEERTLDLIVQNVENEVDTNKKVRFGGYREGDISKGLFFKLAKKLPDEYVPNVYCHDILEIKEYLTFCMEDKRWFIQAKMFDEALANKVFEASDVFNDLQRYAMIVSRCCKCGEIPTYQAKRLKAFSVLIQLYGYNYSQVLPAMMSKFDADGKLIPEEPTTSKPKADDSLRYVIIKDGNIKVYKTKEARDEENTLTQGLALDLTKTQLRKKMDELLES